MKIICNISVFYLDKTVPKGSLLIECGHLLEKKKYQIRFFNTINFKKSLHYNPFHYIHSEKDILKLANVLITNTDGGQKSGDPFWRNAEMLLYCALMGYIFYEAPPHEQNFNTLVAMINAMEVHEDDDNFKNPVRQYHKGESHRACQAAIARPCFSAERLLRHARCKILFEKR